MYKKVIEIADTKCNVYKCKATGIVFYEYKQLLNILNLKSYSNYYEPKIKTNNLIYECTIDNKIIKLVNIKNIIKLTNVFKDIKNQDLKNIAFEKRKGLSTKAKNEMKLLIPTELITMLTNNKVEDYFKHEKESSYLNKYSLLIDNLYSFKINKLQLKKRILKVSKIRQRKDFTKTKGELIVTTIEKDILIDELKVSKSNTNKLNKIIKKMESNEGDLQKKIKKLEPEFHYYFQENFVYSYNRAITIKNGRIVSDPKYKTWKTNLAEKIRKKCYTKYLIQTPIFKFANPSYILIDMKIYLLKTYAIPDSKVGADLDNYYKCIQDAISLALGINDKYFKINSLEFIPVDDKTKQGYHFGLRAE